VLRHGFVLLSFLRFIFPEKVASVWECVGNALAKDIEGFPSLSFNAGL
jgi:hypothetical protein